MRPTIWIGRIEAYYTDSETPSAWKPAFANVAIWARDADEFSQKCSRMLENYGWKPLGIERPNPVFDEGEFDEDVTDMLERTRENPIAIIYGTFHTYPKM